MKNVVAISLVIFLVPLAGCLDELTEPTKTELTDKEVILPGGDYWRGGPAVGYGQFEYEIDDDGGVPVTLESTSLLFGLAIMAYVGYCLANQKVCLGSNNLVELDLKWGTKEDNEFVFKLHVIVGSAFGICLIAAPFLFWNGVPGL